jgi:hypothetical protein
VDSPGRPWRGPCSRPTACVMWQDNAAPGPIPARACGGSPRNPRARHPAGRGGHSGSRRVGRVGDLRAPFAPLHVAFELEHPALEKHRVGGSPCAPARTRGRCASRRASPLGSRGGSECLSRPRRSGGCRSARPSQAPVAMRPILRRGPDGRCSGRGEGPPMLPLRLFPTVLAEQQYEPCDRSHRRSAGSDLRASARPPIVIGSKPQDAWAT